jgi:hypothetical protein
MEIGDSVPDGVSRVELFATFEKPVLILVGHFGSGKTEVAVNLAFAVRASGREAALGDLDLVKPYFRCRLVRDDLLRAGIDLIAPEGDRFFADLPILVPQIRAAADRAGSGGPLVILDVGGDDTGARVLGSLGATLRPEHVDVLFVVNLNRPFAEDETAVLEMLREVETAARMRVTGFVANTHLMDETTAADVRAGLVVTQTLSQKTGIPIRFCAALESLGPALQKDGADLGEVPLLTLRRYILPPHVRRRPGSRRSLAV